MSYGLDHDLGGHDTGRPIVLWLAERDRWPAVVRAHGANPVGGAVWARRRAGHDPAGAIHHTDAGAQYTAVRFAEGLVGAAVIGSIGSVGDSYDNALAETINGLYKTELIRPRKPWKTVEQVEYGTAEWVDWFNHRRPYEYCGVTSPTCGVGGRVLCCEGTPPPGDG